MKIRIEYFAILKDQRGLSSESVETGASTPGMLYTELAARHRFTVGTASLKVAVNEEFASWETPLSDNDTVVFIPPMAGG